MAIQAVREEMMTEAPEMVTISLEAVFYHFLQLKTVRNSVMHAASCDDANYVTQLPSGGDDCWSEKCDTRHVHYLFKD